MIRIEHGFVIKTYPTAAQEEFEKAQALWALSAAGAFHTPRPLSLDAKANNSPSNICAGCGPSPWTMSPSSESSRANQSYLSGFAWWGAPSPLYITISP
jgi:hypothetical protein